MGAYTDRISHGTSLSLRAYGACHEASGTEPLPPQSGGRRSSQGRRPSVFHEPTTAPPLIARPLTQISGFHSGPPCPDMAPSAGTLTVRRAARRRGRHLCVWVAGLGGRWYYSDGVQHHPQQTGESACPRETR